MANNSAFFVPTQTPTDNSASAQHLRRLQAARDLLVDKGFNSRSAVWLTALPQNDEDLKPGAKSPPPMVCEAIGHYAAYHLAAKTHRLATAEEIQRFRTEQRQREEVCAAQTEIQNAEQSVRFTSAFSEAIKQLGPRNGKKGT